MLNKRGFEVFDKIKADQVLKDKTREFLRQYSSDQPNATQPLAEQPGADKVGNALPVQTPPGKALPARRYGRRSRLAPRLAMAAVLLIVALSGFGYFRYFTPAAYVDLDVNPSIGLVLNRAGDVLSAGAYNAEGEAMLQRVDVRRLPYDEAVQLLLAEMISQGYLQQERLVSATVQATDSNAEQKLLRGVDTALNTTLYSHHTQAETDVFAVSDDVRQNAAGYSLSPAKYLAIEELRELDEYATFEGCASHSIGEIRQRIRSCHEAEDGGQQQQHRHHHGHGH